MSTNMQVSPRTDSGELLLDRLKSLEGLTYRFYSGLYRHAYSGSCMDSLNEASRILLRAGYRLPTNGGAVEVVDGRVAISFLASEVYPLRKSDPYWIALDFDTGGTEESEPKIALIYRNDRDQLVHYEESSRIFVSRTSNHEAREIVGDFKRDHPNKPYLWMPVFGTEWIPL